MNTVYSYRFSQPNNEHPLHFRLDDQDFVRVEGIVGKPLGSAMAELIAYKQALGLSFSIEPVFMRLAAGENDETGKALDKSAEAAAIAAARKMLLCRFSELDLIFLILIGALFAFLFFLIQRLGQLIPGGGGGPPQGGFNAADDIAVGPAVDGGPAIGVAVGGLATAFLDPATAARFRVDLTPEAEAKLKVESETLRTDLKKTMFERGDIVARLNPDAKPASAAAVFAAVKDDAGGGNLFDRTQAFVIQQGGDVAAVRATYAPVALMAQSEQLMGALNVEGIADFDEEKFSKAYRGFADSFQAYAQVVRDDPPKDPALAQQQVQIAAAANNVASQTGAFAAANIRAEFTAAVQRLFENLTLKGFARRHPGLEHHAGVPVGGTLVLAYVSRDVLAQQAGPILDGLKDPLGGLNSALGPNAAAVALASAIQELAASTADRTEDPLDRFVILADFCLPYQCCDADCSDVVLSERILANPFGAGIDPKPMAVPPLDPTEIVVTAPRPGGIGIFGPGDITIGRRPVAVGGALVGGLTGAFETFTPLPGGNGDTPTRPGGGEAVVTGIVGIQRGSRVTRLRDSKVVFTTGDGRERSQTTEEGQFTITVPAGAIKIRGTSPGHRGVTQSLDLERGERRELTLLATPTG